MIWWILGGSVGGVLLLLWVWATFFYKNIEYIQIREHGERLMAWILPIAAADVGHSYLVMVIFTFDKSIKEMPAFLDGVASRMMALEGQSLPPNEAAVVRWMKEFTTWKMISTREKLPNSLTNGHTVWCQKGYAKKSLLPGGKLGLQYFYIAADRDNPRYIPMVEYPEES